MPHSAAGTARASMHSRCSRWYVPPHLLRVPQVLIVLLQLQRLHLLYSDSTCKTVVERSSQT